MLPDPALPLPRRAVSTVIDRFLAIAVNAPDAEAVRDERQRLTYRDLERASRALACDLVARGLQPGDRVALWAERGVALPVAMLGVLRARGVFAVLDATYPAERLAKAVALVGPRFFVTLEGAPPVPEPVVSAAARAASATLDVVPRTLVAAADAALAEVPSPPTPDDPAYILFTSGTTGTPKAILTTHAPLPHFLEWHARTFDLTSADRISVLSGLSHDPVLRDIFAPLGVGAAAVFPPPSLLKDPTALREWLAIEKISVSHMTPALAQLLLEGKPTIERIMLRLVCLGGAALRLRDVARVRELGPDAEVVNFYGTSETPQAVSFYRVPPSVTLPSDERGLSQSVPVGWGIDDVQLLVLSKEGALAAVGEEGEILVRTPYLSEGYLGLGAETSQRYIVSPFTGDTSDRLYRTGDRGVYREAGEVEYRGRIDDQLKVRGFRVEPADVETAILAGAGVGQSAVVGIDDGEGDVRLHAFVVASPGATLDERSLRAFVRSVLPDYMCPNVWHVVDVLPLTPNGKVDRQALRSRPNDAAIGRVRGRIAREPSTNTERSLLAMWRRLLRAPELGPDDDFFDSGGHSLLALRLLTEVEKQLGKRVPMQTLLTSPTVARLAALIDSGEGLGSRVLVKLRDGQPRPPLVWLPGGGGLSVLGFRTISTLLGDRQPVFGVEVPVEQAHQRHTVEERATEYVRELRALQPRGPYFLLGFSLGSWIGFEMARQLEAEGESMGLLVLFDTHCAPRHLQRPLDQALIRAERYAYHARRIMALPNQEKTEYLRGAWKTLRVAADEKIAQRGWELARRVKNVGGRKVGHGKDKPLEVDDIDKANRQALREYAESFSPTPIRAPLLLVLAERTSFSGVSEARDPRLGWRRFTTGPVKVVRVPGNHTSMVDLPDADRLAAVLRAEIAEAQNRVGIS